LQTTSVEGALASGQFVVAERDREFLARLTDARQLAADFNQRLIFMEAQMAALSPDDVARYRQTIRDGKTRASVVSIESGLAEHLISKYGVRKDDVFFAKYQ
jgi:hypothetical protein